MYTVLIILQNLQIQHSTKLLLTFNILPSTGNFVTWQMAAVAKTMSDQDQKIHDNGYQRQ